MRYEPGRPSRDDLNPYKPITVKQRRYIKGICHNRHRQRAESVVREVEGKDIWELNQLQAHELILYLEDREFRKGALPLGKIEVELGQALITFDPNNSIANSRIRVLALLATNRVATPGQLARYVYSIKPETYEAIRENIEALLQQTYQEGLIGCVRDLPLPAGGKTIKTDVYYLTEIGSDEFHKIAPEINYYARPNLPPRNRIYHELCVTSARLDLQSNNHLLSYEPESEIRSQLQKERKSQSGSEKSFNGGCGDFRAWLVDTKSGERKKIEVEIIIRSRQKEVSNKPTRITHYYAGSQHRCFLIELTQRKFAKLVPDVREPLIETEMILKSSRPSAARATVSKDRVKRVREVVEKMGGVATSEAIAKVTGLRNSTVSEALSLLAEKGELSYCDGFSASGKSIGRNLRLYFYAGIKIYSIFDFSRLLNATRLVSTGLANQEYHRLLQPLDFDWLTGIMVLDSVDPDDEWQAIAVIDDPSETPERIIDWARATYNRASDDFVWGVWLYWKDRSEDDPGSINTTELRITENQVMIATAGRERAERLRAISRYRVIDIESVISVGASKRNKQRNNK